MEDSIKYTLEFSSEDLRILDAALVELPFKIVSNLLTNINEQLSAQIESRDSKVD